MRTTPLAWQDLREVARHEAAILRGALVPVVAMVVATVFGLSAWRVDEVGMIAVVAMLMLFAVVGGIRANLSKPVLVLQACLALAFGIFITLIRGVLA